MKLFQCQQCQQLLVFENTFCVRCRSPLGFDIVSRELKTLVAMAGVYRSIDTRNQQHWRYCDNFRHGVCNWLVAAGSNDRFCLACKLNRYIPNLTNIENRKDWNSLEYAKHRLVYSLTCLGLPIHSKREAPATGIAFDFIDTDKPLPANASGTTGHRHGQITITLDEANPAQREQARMDLNETYRTLLGHMRHEIGHYYWEVLILPDANRLSRYRQVFGDERQDYSRALQQHYQRGPAPNWQQRFISAYAASHPWEDWAETWAHYLHIIDTLETAHAVGLSVAPRLPNTPEYMCAQLDFDPYQMACMDTLLEKAVAVLFAANSLNRSMGHVDLYPFVLTNGVKSKLQFVHEVLASQRPQPPGG